jgi:hypothetical protein
MHYKNLTLLYNPKLGLAKTRTRTLRILIILYLQKIKILYLELKRKGTITSKGLMQYRTIAPTYLNPLLRLAAVIPSKFKILFIDTCLSN